MTKTIDYGLGVTNIDKVTGIRFGVISQNEVLQAWADSSEAQYGEAHCPDCGNEAIEYSEEKHCELESNRKHSCADYVCETCQFYFDSSDAFPEEALGYTLEDGQYEACQDSYGDIFITKSPYYTLCEFCSPCAPGAGYIMNDGDVRAYCFGHDWFEDGKAPYKVYSVETNEEITA